MPEIDAKLLTALRQARNAPMNFAFASNGANDGALIVSKNKIAASDVNKAKAKCAAKVVYLGRCLGEGGKLVFEIPKAPPPALAKLLKTVIQRDAGMTSQQIEVRAESAPKEEEAKEEQADEPAQDGEKSTEQTPEAPPEPPPPPKPAAKPLKLKKKLPQTPRPAPVAQAPPPPPSPVDMGMQEEWERRVTDLEPRVLDAKKTRPNDAKWMTLFMRVQDLGEAGKYAEALQMMDKIEGLLAAPAAPAPTDNGTFVAMQKARLEAVQQLRSFWTTITPELQQVEQKLLDACQAFNSDGNSQLRFDLNQVKARTQKLYSVSTALDSRLFDELDDALNADDPARRQALQDKAKQTIAEYMTFVKTNDILQALTQSEIAQSPLQQRLLDALTNLSSKL